MGSSGAEVVALICDKELSQTEVVGGQALLSLDEPVIYFASTPTATIPLLPREINLE